MPVEYCVCSLFFYNLYTNQKVKRVILYSIIPFTIYSIYNLVVTIHTRTFNNNTLVIEFLIFIIFIIYIFYEKMKTVVLYPLYQTITFWICVGFFLYFTGNFFFFLFIKSTTDQHLKNQMKFIYIFVTITKNIFLGLAFLANEVIESRGDNMEIPDNLDLDSFSNKNFN